MGTYPEPEHLGSVRTDGAVLPGQILVDPGALLEVGRVPVVRGLELIRQIQQDGNAAEVEHHKM